MPRIVSLQGHTRADRSAAIWSVKEAIAACGGFLTDATLFSNAAITFHFEIDAAELPAFARALAAAEVSLDAAAPAMAPGEIRASLFLTFVHRDPDLKLDVPAVPG